MDEKNVYTASSTFTARVSASQDAANLEGGINHEEEMPTLVAKLFIESITKVELLKEFRLVCKYWNVEACHSLRKLAITTLKNSEVLNEFHSVLNGGAMLNLPSPFQQFSVTFFETPHVKTLRTLIHQFGLETKNLCVYVHPGDDLDKSGIFLKTFPNEITELRSRTAWSKLHEATNGIAMPSLQTLEARLDALRDQSKYAKYVKSPLFPGCQLTTLKIWLRTALCVSTFVSLDLTRIKHLDVSISVPDSVQMPWETLATVQLPALKVLRLTILDMPRHRHQCLQQVYALLRRVAPSLEVLETNQDCRFWNANISIFPKLKSLSLNGMTQEDIIITTPEKFPRLEEIQIEVTNAGLVNLVDFECVRHEGVRIMSIQNAWCRNVSNQQQPQAWITTLTRKFPNVRGITLISDHRAWYSLCLQQFIRAYPQLKFLKLTGLDDWPKEGNIEGVSQNISPMVYILDFPNLASLELNQTGLSNQKIINVVARIPKLKYLKIDWSERLSVDVFRNSLQHLHVLEIVNLKVWKNIIMQLRAVLPETLIKAKYSP